jgi:acetyl esterase
MSLDPATVAFLEGVRASGGKPANERTVEEFRANVRASGMLAAPAEDVYHVAEQRIGPGGEVGLRIYTPRPVADGQPLPIVLQFHGAGFVAGDLDTHDSVSRYYCRHADAIVIGVDYRLAPEHPFPAAVDDAYAAVAWASEHARDLDGDAAKMAVTGDSAGGNLAAVVCQLAKARQGPAIAFQALLYPTLNMDPSSEYGSRVEFGGGEFFLSNHEIEWFRSLYLAGVPALARDPRVSPLLAEDLAGLPPAVVVTAGCDPLCDEGKAYADRLAAAGVPVEYHCFQHTIHAFVSFAAAIPAGLEALSFVASRLRSALHRR